jgi:excisionase family DNA binding protein
MPETYLTPEQVADRLQVNKMTIYRWLRTGKLKASLLSRKTYRIAESDLQVLMTATQNVVKSKNAGKLL